MPTAHLPLPRRARSAAHAGADRVAHAPATPLSAKATAALAPPPLAVAQLVLSDLCRHACRHCVFRAEGSRQNEWFAEVRFGRRHDNPARMLPEGKALELLDDLPALGCREVEFTGGGEPLLHPGAARVFARALRRGLRATLATNAQGLRPELDRVLVRFARVHVSLDAANPETYARLRRVDAGMLVRVLAHVERLRRVRDHERAPLLLTAGFVVSRDNWREVTEAVRLYHDAGFDGVRLEAMRHSGEGAGHFAGCLDAARDACAAAREQQRAGFTVDNRFAGAFDERTGGNDGAAATATIATIATIATVGAWIGADQRLYRDFDTAYSPEGFLGSLAGRPLGEVWREAWATGLLTANGAVPGAIA